jgi:hypothetical protein
VRRSYCKVENPTAGIEKIRRNNIISLKNKKTKIQTEGGVDPSYKTIIPNVCYKTFA